MKRWAWARSAILVMLATGGQAGAAPAKLTADMRVLAVCGESKGTTFYLEGGLVPPGQGGWRNDGMTGGAIVLVETKQGLDILFKDATGARSHRQEGSDVHMVGAAKAGSFLVIAENANGSAVEHFLFRLNSVGAGTVVWGTTRASDTYTKSSVMTAPCGTK